MASLRLSKSVAAIVATGIMMMSGLHASTHAEQPKQWVGENLASLVELYLYFHRNPELSFEERETAARIAEELEAVGAEVTKNIGGHGVVGVLRNGAG